MCTTLLGEKWQRSISFCPAPSSLADSQALSIELAFQGLSGPQDSAVPQHIRNSRNFIAEFSISGPKTPFPLNSTDEKENVSAHNQKILNSEKPFSSQGIPELFVDLKLEKSSHMKCNTLFKF